MSSLRPMTPLDLLNFGSCNLDPLTETYNIGFYLEYLAKWPGLCQVMESHDGRIEGYILGKIESSPHMQPTSQPYSPDTNKNDNYLPWHAHITCLTVAPAARRLGHARKLTEMVEMQGDIANAWFVDLFVRSDNRNAMHLYEGMGYSVFRRVVGYYQDGADAWDMRKSLNRDKEKKHIRENGKHYHVDPAYVWDLGRHWYWQWDQSGFPLPNERFQNKSLLVFQDRQLFARPVCYNCNGTVLTNHSMKPSSAHDCSRDDRCPAQIWLDDDRHVKPLPDDFYDFWETPVMWYPQWRDHKYVEVETMREWTGNWVAELCTRQQYSASYKISERHVQQCLTSGRVRGSTTNFPAFPTAVCQTERQDRSSDVTLVSQGDLDSAEQLSSGVESLANYRPEPADAQLEDQDLEHQDRPTATQASIIGLEATQGQEPGVQTSEQSLNPTPGDTTPTPTPTLPLGQIISTIVRQLIEGAGSLLSNPQ